MKIYVKSEDDIGLDSLVDKAVWRFGKINNGGVMILGKKGEKREYALPNDGSVYEISTIEDIPLTKLEAIISDEEERKIGIEIYFDPESNDWILSMDSNNMERTWWKASVTYGRQKIPRYYHIRWIWSNQGVSFR